MKYLIKVSALTELAEDFKGVAYVQDDEKVFVKGFGSNYDVVDLGLPSGLKWGSCNLGAEKPEDAGLYFQWGDPKGYSADEVGSGEGQKQFDSSFSDYVLYDAETGAFTKYNGEDNITTLESADDAVKVLLGDNFRMPTKEDLKELFIETDQKLILSDGEEISRKTEPTFDSSGYGNLSWESFTLGERTIKGMKFIASNGNSIFVPAAGYANDGQMWCVGEYGYLWSSSLDEDSEGSVVLVLFDSDGAGVGYGFRYYGMPVRGVRL